MAVILLSLDWGFLVSVAAHQLGQAITVAAVGWVVLVERERLALGWQAHS